MKKIFLLTIPILVLLVSCEKKSENEINQKFMKLDSSKSYFTDSYNSDNSEQIDYSQFEQKMYDENGDLLLFVYLYDHLNEKVSAVVENTQSEFRFDRGTRVILISYGYDESKVLVAPESQWDDKYDSSFLVVQNVNLYSKIPQDKIIAENYSPDENENSDSEEIVEPFDLDKTIAEGYVMEDSPKYMNKFYEYWKKVQVQNEDKPLHINKVLNQYFEAIAKPQYADNNYTYLIKSGRVDDEESSFIFEVYPGMKIANFKISSELGNITDNVYNPYYSGTIGLDDGQNFTKTININSIDGDMLANGFSETDIDEDYKFILAYKKCAPVDYDEFESSKLETIYDDYMFWEIHGLRNGYRNREVVLMKVPKKQFDKEDTEARWNDFSMMYNSKVKTWNLLEEDYAEGGFIEGNLKIFYKKDMRHPVPIILKQTYNGGMGGGANSYEWYALDPENAGIRKICDYSYVSCEAVNGESNYSLYGNTLSYSVFEQEAGCPVSQNDTFVYEQSNDDPLRFDLADHYEGQMK